MDSFRRSLTALSAAALLAAGSTSQAVPTAGLRAWYPFEGNVLDASGNGFHGTVHNGFGYVPGHVGQAGEFDGTSSWVAVDVPLAPGDWTVCGWVWLDSLNSGFTDWQNFASTNASGFAVGVATGNGRLTLWIGGATCQSPQPFPIQQWVFFLAERTGNTLRLEQDGAPAGTATGTFTPPTVAVLGQWMPDNSSPSNREPFDGRMDDLCVYNRALSPAEKSELLAACPASLPAPQLSVAGQAGEALLEWAPVPGAQRFEVWGGAPGAHSLLGSTAQNHWLQDVLPDNGGWTWQVVARCD